MAWWIFRDETADSQATEENTDQQTHQDTNKSTDQDFKKQGEEYDNSLNKTRSLPDLGKLIEEIESQLQQQKRLLSKTNAALEYYRNEEKKETLEIQRCVEALNKFTRKFESLSNRTTVSEDDASESINSDGQIMKENKHFLNAFRAILLREKAFHTNTHNAYNRICDIHLKYVRDIEIYGYALTSLVREVQQKQEIIDKLFHNFESELRLDCDKLNTEAVKPAKEDLDVILSEIRNSTQTFKESLSAEIKNIVKDSSPDKYQDSN
ncbi:MAG: hypothetical protein AAF609_04605 [Cyanobacteria bacterium P01_C01_bin.120]